MLAASPEYKKDLKLVKFSRTYFVDFLLDMAGNGEFTREIKNVSIDK